MIFSNNEMKRICDTLLKNILDGKYIKHHKGIVHPTCMCGMEAENVTFFTKHYGTDVQFIVHYACGTTCYLNLIMEDVLSLTPFRITIS